MLLKYNETDDKLEHTFIVSSIHVLRQGDKPF